MENATKALIIAGAVLISILLISVGIMVFNAANEPIGQAQTSSEQQAAQMFNESFTSYLGTKVSAQQAKGVISAVQASNAKNDAEHQVELSGKTKVSEISSKSKYDIIEEYGDGNNSTTKGYICKITITEK